MIYTRINNIASKYGWVITLALAAIYAWPTAYPITVCISAWIIESCPEFDAVAAVMVGYSIALIACVAIMRLLDSIGDWLRERFIQPRCDKEIAAARLDRLMDELHRNPEDKR